MQSINIDYLFGKIYDFGLWVYHTLFGISIGRGLAIIAGILVVAFLFVIFYSSIRMKEIDHEEKKKKEEKMMAAIPVAAPKHDKWILIKAHMMTQNQAEWRLAIIEADILLDELTFKLGLPGDTMADRLKSVAPADFNTIQAAWEAHKVRNRISHDGSDFELTHAEANRVIRMYEDVFNEFNFI